LVQGEFDLASGSNDYERQDINPKLVIIYSVLGMIILVVILVLLRDYFMIEKENIVYDTTLKPVSAELRDIQAKDTEILTNYKLLDKQNGIYQIPIDQAMRLIAEENFQQRMDALRKSR
jgi:hypothetical protein